MDTSRAEGKDSDWREALERFFYGVNNVFFFSPR